MIKYYCGTCTDLKDILIKDLKELEKHLSDGKPHRISID